MPPASGPQLYSARPRIQVDGTDQPSLVAAALMLEASDDLRGMKRLEARFENWGTPPGGGQPGFMYFDGGVLAFGKKIEVTLGADADAKVVFSGRITAITGRFGATSPPEILVAAEDQLMFLRMTRRTATYEKVSDADVAKRIAQAHSLTPDADAPGPTYDVLAQIGQTDLAFLRERAAAIDAQVWMEGDKLKFKARTARDGGTVSLALGETLNRFEATADLAHQVTSVHAHGYDVSAKADADQEAASSLLSSETAGAKSGADVLKQAFGERVEHIVHQQIATSDEARIVAKAELLARGRAFVRGRGETEGTPAMQVGTKITVDKVGPIFNGTYVATRVTHRFDREHGFKTTFEAERPAVGKES